MHLLRVSAMTVRSPRSRSDGFALFCASPAHTRTVSTVLGDSGSTCAGELGRRGAEAQWSPVHLVLPHGWSKVVLTSEVLTLVPELEEHTWPVAGIPAQDVHTREGGAGYYGRSAPELRRPQRPFCASFGTRSPAQPRSRRRRYPAYDGGPAPVADWNASETHTSGEGPGSWLHGFGHPVHGRN
uniref:Uncharacterized protein n=1 Tax=Mycena chlorophos TaxID=658473 RepID=A0ABQ0L5Y2_MYCCL|nr:predicted protein [Mycena chlorophos]